MRTCEICNKEIPEEFMNALCLECYQKQTKENEQRKELEKEDLLQAGKPLPEEVHKQNANSHIPVVGITDPKYKTNAQQDEIDLVQRNYIQYTKSGKWLWKPTRTMYNFIRDSFIDIVKSHPQYPKFVWKPTVCDIGCGSGCGSNILSQEADFVWGIDKCENSIAFARELFSRQKNNIYYTPEIRFDIIDIENPPPNIDMKFDTCVAVEVLEHLENHDNLLQFMKNILRPNGIAWISSPNRNNKHISSEHPKNKYHVKELTSQEFVAILKQHFNFVQLFNSAGEPIEGDDTTHTPILALMKNII